MTNKQKKHLTRIIIAAALFAAALVVTRIWDLPWYLELAIFLIPYLAVGFDVLREAAENIAHGQVFDENFLMAVASIGAFAIGEYPEAVAVMLFYQIGELFQAIAVGKTRRSISALMDIRPETARVIRGGEETEVDPSEVQLGEEILVLVGERVPIDGMIVEGSTQLNTAALTGESMPRECVVGDNVISGSVNMGSVIRVQTTSLYENSTVAKILELVESSDEKSREKVKSRELHYKIRRSLHPRGGNCGGASGSLSSAFIPRRLERVDTQGFDIPGGVLPLRIGDIRAAFVLLRHGRRFKARHPYKGLELRFIPCQGPHYGV